MPIDHFTREQFEAALPQGVSIHGTLVFSEGVVDGEYCYRIPVVSFRTNVGLYIAIRSSVKADGHSADTGEDSIRLYLMCPTGPVASKLTKYVTRVKGWEQRMTVQLRTLYKIGLSLKPCLSCGALRHAFIAGKGKDAKAKPENKGRLFQRCVTEDGMVKGKRGCRDSFEWIEFKEDRK